MTYGWMTAHDFATMDSILDLVCNKFPEGIINTCEIGVNDGRGSRGIHQYLADKQRINFHVGIDNGRDMDIKVPFEGCKIIIGNSIEVYNQVPDNSQHFLLIDGCHNYPMTMADFLVYSDKVRVNGFLAFHDTSPAIKEFTDFQGMGSTNEKDMYISCRKAIKKLGLLENKYEGWILILDEYDETKPTGGITLFQKIK